MSFDLIMEIVKAVGLITTGCLGAIGIFGDFRKQNSDELTGYGKAMLWGVAVSTLLTLAATLYQDRQNDDDIAKELFALDRIQKPLGELTVAFTLALPVSDPDVKSYLALLREERMTHRSFFPQVRLGAADVPTDDQPALKSLFEHFNLTAYMFGKDQMACCDALHADVVAGDVNQKYPMLPKDSGTYFLADNGMLTALYLYGEIHLDKYWESGAIGSLPELRGAKLAIRFFVAGDRSGKALRIFNASTLDRLTLTVSKSKTLILENVPIGQVRDQNFPPIPVYMITLPSSDTELQRLFMKQQNL